MGGGGSGQADAHSRIVARGDGQNHERSKSDDVEDHRKPRKQSATAAQVNKSKCYPADGQSEEDWSAEIEEVAKQAIKICQRVRSQHIAVNGDEIFRDPKIKEERYCQHDQKQRKRQ